MSTDRSVLALDNVRVELPIASAGSRTLAGLIDYTVFYGLFFALGLVAVVTITSVGLTPDSMSGILWTLGFFLLAFFALEIGYFAGQELLLGGQTLGKRAAGLRVVAASGGRASPLPIILRNLVRTFDLLIGMWFLVLDPKARRIGDHLAGTLVVHIEAGQPHTGIARTPVGWGVDRIGLVETLMARLGSLQPEVADRLARRLLDLVAQEDPTFLHGIPDDLWPTTRLMTAFGAAGATGPPPPPAAAPDASPRDPG